MIKKLQALKAKKGFTLVELIVVIAIIGVLAAILVPTMMGYVTSSRVQSVNSTAAALQDTTNTFIVDMDTKGYSTLKTGTGKWVMENGQFTTFDTGVLGTKAVAVAGDYQEELEAQIAEDYGNIVWATIYIENGKVAACTYCADNAPTDAPEFSSGAWSGSWSDTDGITTGGSVVGTSPAFVTALGGGTTT